MQEVTSVPELQSFPLSTDGMRFAVVHTKKYLNPEKHNLVEGTHIHNCVELLVLCRGEMSFLVGNRIYPLREGGAILSHSNELHVAIFESVGIYEYFCVWVEADECSPFLSFLKNLKENPLVFDSKTWEEMYPLLLSTGNKKTDPLKRAADFLQLLVLFRNCQLKTVPEHEIPPLLQKILDDIHENFAEINHVNDIVERHFISPATLNRWFRKYIRISPREFIEAEKLAQAARILATGESVTEACLQAGFSDCSHFIALFKKRFGETPRKYKQRVY